MDFVLVGAGGHAKVLLEIIARRGDRVAGYVALEDSAWLAAPRIRDEASVTPDISHVALGIGGTTPERLRRRLDVLNGWLSRGFEAPALVHHSAVVSEFAVVEAGAVVLANAVVQPGARVRRGAIVNTGAIVEHDSDLGAGAHVAPGGILLGDAKVGDCTMVGAGAVVLQGCEVPGDTLVKATTLHRGKSRT